MLPILILSEWSKFIAISTRIKISQYLYEGRQDFIIENTSTSF